MQVISRVETPEIPISAAKKIADKYGFDQIIIIGRKVDVCEHVTTYGTNPLHCAIAAQAGDFLKHDVMKWPRKCVDPKESCPV